MENQINIGTQRQPYEPFEEADSEAENSGAKASLAGDSTSANTGDNADIVSPQSEGENANQAPPESAASTMMLNRYGIGDTVILGRPEYALDNRAAAFGTALAPGETADAKQLEKAPADATSAAKDAASALPPHGGTKLPLPDSVAFTAARDYGAQHGFSKEETDQVAAILAYFHCQTSQQCGETLGSLPFHISSIMQAMGANNDGLYNVGSAMRCLQQAQAIAGGDPNDANRNLPDGRADRGVDMMGVQQVGGARGVARAGAGQGSEDYAREMSAATYSTDTNYYDLGDDYRSDFHDASQSSDARDSAESAPQIDLDLLTSMPPVDPAWPMMLPEPVIHLDHEFAPIPTVDIAGNQNASNLNGAGASVPPASTSPEDNPTFMGYNTDGQPLFSDSATQRYAPSGIGETGYRLTGMASAVQGSVLGFDAAGTPYSGVRNAAGEMRWYALGFAEASSIMNARANGAFPAVGALSLSATGLGTAAVAGFTMVMPSNAGRDTNTTELADGTRFVVGAGALVGRLEARDANGNWAVVEHGVSLDPRTGTAFSTLTDDQRRAAGLPPSLPPPNPGSGFLTNPALTDDERSRFNGTTINPIPPGSLPPLGGFQTTTQTTEDLIIESSRAPNGSARANGYDYEFDSNSRIDNVEGDLNREDGIRNRAHQSGAGGADRLPDDDGGHIVGNRFNPPGDEFNYVAQNSNFNRGSYRQLENEWAQLLADGHTVHVRWDFEYSGDSQRPNGFNVTYNVDDGEPVVRQFQNRHGGK